MLNGFGTRLVTAQEMRELDALATTKYGIPSLILMENAGRAVADIAMDMLGDNRSVLIIAGPGNNGGDGFVAARHLHNVGMSVDIFYFGDRQKAKGDALTNIEIAEKMGLHIDSSKDVVRLRQAIRAADLIVDAYLGTGVKGELKPEAVEVINAINTMSSENVLSVDIPSGLDADTGLPLGPSLTDGAVIADMTVTFALPKIGVIVDPNAETFTGGLIIADIGIPVEELDIILGTYALQEFKSIDPLQPRWIDAHKGTYGHVAIVAGSVGMTGAATLAAESALKSGAGLVTLLVPESLNDIIEAKVTEAMTIPVPQGNAQAFGMASLEKVLEYVNKWDAAAIGPGFGRDSDTVAFTKELLRNLEKPAVVDADALYAISQDLSVLKQCKAGLVLTPHPGEMAMLAGTSVSEVQSNRLETAKRFAGEYGVILVLKGARTVIAEPGGNAFINMTGTPGMATGGTGDVLTGLMAGLVAQAPGYALWGAANQAVFLHGRAGEIAAERLGEAAMIASDVLNCLPEVLKELEQNF